MTSAVTPYNNSLSSQFYNHLIFGILILITIIRSIALHLTPLELGVDEAQYWLWSQSPDFGYFTKPPLIAWIIAIPHWLFGHYTWAVRLPACWIHLVTALLLWRGSIWLYGQNAGRVSALIWITLPATGLGSFLISTDTPLLCLWSAGLLAICGVVSGRLSPAASMILSGLAFGLAMLAKFAAIYAIIGLIMILLHDHIVKQRLIRWHHFMMMLITFGIAASPTIIWNIANEFSTFLHLGENANIGQHSPSLTGIWQFVGGQFAVAGPLIFILMLIASASQWHNKKTRFLIWMSSPILFLMIVQSFLSEANANWAVTAYPALTILTAGWLVGSDTLKRHLKTAAIGINITLSFFVLITTLTGSMGLLTPESDPLRRLRGWQQLAEDIVPHIAAHNATAIIADRRATAALLSWHFYKTPVEILVHDEDSIPSNHFEAKHFWSPKPNRQLIAIYAKASPPAIAGINWVPPTDKSTVRVSKNKMRQFNIFRGIEQVF